MLNTTYTRTTITLPTELLFMLKKKALISRKSLTEIVNEGLKNYAGMNYSPSVSKTLMELSGSWKEEISGKSFLKRVRYSNKDKAREKYLSKIWNKSS